MKQLTPFVFLFLLYSGLAVMAQGDVKKHPGYFDLSRVNLLKREDPSVEMFINRDLLKVVAESTKNEDPELANELSELQLIQVRGFTPKTQRNDIGDKIRDAVTLLEREGWQTAGKMREKTEQIYVYLKSSNDKTAGLVVLVVKPTNEVVLINIVGNINLSKLARLGRKLNIKSLDNIHLDGGK